MTPQEAINWIRLDIDMAKFDPFTGEEAYLNDDAKKVIEAMEMGIEALEKHVPKIITSPIAGGYAICPVCGRKCENSHDYCPWCGQRIER